MDMFQLICKMFPFHLAVCLSLCNADLFKLPLSYVAAKNSCGRGIKYNRELYETHCPNLSNQGIV